MSWPLHVRRTTQISSVVILVTLYYIVSTGWLPVYKIISRPSVALCLGTLSSDVFACDVYIFLSLLPAGV